MKRPINIGEIFEISDSLEYIVDEDVVIVDNFYKNPDMILEWIESQDYPLWKYTGYKDSKNGIDYYDCRLNHVFHSNVWQDTTLEGISKVAQATYNLPALGLPSNPTVFRDVIINCFQTVKIFEPEYQFIPHTDVKLAALVYLDKVENGGTAFYSKTVDDDYDEAVNGLMNVVDNKEGVELTKIVNSKFNRCIFFPGQKPHGAFISDYNAYSQKEGTWRYSQVYFFMD